MFANSEGDLPLDRDYPVENAPNHDTDETAFWLPIRNPQFRKRHLAGAGSIGGSRTALLNKADELDMGGKLSVSDQRVLMITGAQLTAEQAAALSETRRGRADHRQRAPDRGGRRR